MISYVQAIVLGLLQGVSELFPISSLGHSVILPKLLGWNLDTSAKGPTDSAFLTFLVATHLATALVLVGFFWRDWGRILRGMGRSLAQREIRADDVPAKLGWLLVVGSIPAGVLGLLLEHALRAMFTSPRIAAGFLIANGLLLFGCEALRKRKEQRIAAEEPDQEIAKLNWSQALLVGAAQAIALIPGFSRSGAAMGGGLLVGLDNEDAARFSFLLATPIILLAALLKVPELFLPENRELVGPSIVGALCSAVSAFLAVRFLLRYFETRRLTAFAVYCAVAGALSSLAFLMKP